MCDAESLVFKVVQVYFVAVTSEAHGFHGEECLAAFAGLNLRAKGGGEVFAVWGGVERNLHGDGKGKGDEADEGGVGWW